MNRQQTFKGIVVSKKRLLVADLFCGAGGTSTGVTLAADDINRRVHITAVNHWDRAVETHAANHPDAAHFCQDLTRLKPREAVPGGRLDLLVASPECTHHSNARGGKPKNDQSRASAWIVLEWVNALQVDRVLIENVPEFESWGPMGTDGKPLKSRRGETFQSFISALKASGYQVSYRVLNSADYGAATSRRRMFIQATKGRRPIVWPDHTHARHTDGGMFGTLPRWRAAREIIDWKLTGESIFTRKRQLSENTLARIEAGLRKFGGKHAEPFLVAMNYLRDRSKDNRHVHSLNEPIPTVTAGNRFAFIIPQHSHNEPRSTDRPVPTITTTSRGMGLVQPFLLTANHGADPDGGGHARRSHSADSPLGTVTAGGKTHALVELHLVQLTHGGRLHDVNDPLPTVTTAKRGEIAVVQPFILPHRKFDRMDVDSVDQPIRTIDATNGNCNAVVEPFVVPYYGTAGSASVGEPLQTVTTKDRFGLVEPTGQVAVDIRFRMLQPHELKAAMGFPSDYKITGNRVEQVKQIGNAVEVNQAKALAGSMIGGAT